ncbi:MAG: DUF1905 domain-containing protein [Hyphomonadaceae bacterium]|nr:DUF1905 domain-containing protein [Hyphomonadaceae bacterium]
MSARFPFSARLWRYSGQAAWHFVTVPRDISDRMRALSGGLRNAFGSLRVIARVGQTEWRTSVFPDAKSGAFLLPVKAGVRRKEKIGDGDAVDVVLEIDL